MITDIDTFLRYFDGIHRRTVRDIGALPPEAEGWAPPSAREGENAWSIADIVRHMVSGRIYFPRAYRAEGWIVDWMPEVTQSRSTWLPGLEASAAEFRRRLEGTPTEWLTRKVPLADSEGTIRGWRVLMMMIEHEVHHRSQIDTYAGLQGWEVPHMYGRSAEEAGLERLQQREQHPDS